MLPPALWDRANGLDTSMYSLTAVVGPAIAGLVVANFGPEAGLLLTAGVVAIASLSLVGVHEPIARVDSGGSLIGDARAALLYVVRHASLRGLAVTLFLANLGCGVIPVGLPVLVLRHLHGSAANVGQIFAVVGLAGLAAGLLIGRLNTEGRERLLIAGCIAIQVPTLVLLAFTSSWAMVFAIAVIAGATGSIINVGIFALRQRRQAEEEGAGRSSSNVEKNPSDDADAKRLRAIRPDAVVGDRDPGDQRQEHRGKEHDSKRYGIQQGQQESGEPQPLDPRTP